MFHVENAFYDTVQDLIALVQLGREIDSKDGLIVRSDGDAAVHAALQRIQFAVELEKAKLEEIKQVTA